MRRRSIKVKFTGSCQYLNWPNLSFLQLHLRTLKRIFITHDIDYYYFHWLIDQTQCSLSVSNRRNTTQNIEYLSLLWYFSPFKLDLKISKMGRKKLFRNWNRFLTFPGYKFKPFRLSKHHPYQSASLPNPILPLLQSKTKICFNSCVFRLDKFAQK